jgi:hypothetical protein
MAKRTIEEINKAIKQMEAQRDAIFQRQKTVEREQSTRQKIIIGGWVLANDQELVEKVKNSLKRDQDRKAFGMEPLLSLEVKKTADNAESEDFSLVSVPH